MSDLDAELVMDIDLPNKSIQCLVSYLYTGHMKNLTKKGATKLKQFAELWNITDLVELCQTQLTCRFDKTTKQKSVVPNKQLVETSTTRHSHDMEWKDDQSDGNDVTPKREKSETKTEYDEQSDDVQMTADIVLQNHGDASTCDDNEEDDEESDLDAHKIFIELLFEPNNQLLLKLKGVKQCENANSSKSRKKGYCAKCYVCQEMFSSNNDCLEHILQSHTEGPENRCRKWNIDVSGKIQNPNVRVIFKCSFCKSGMGSLRGARFHARRIHGVQKCPMAIRRNPKEDDGPKVREKAQRSEAEIASELNHDWDDIWKHKGKKGPTTVDDFVDYNELANDPDTAIIEVHFEPNNQLLLKPRGANSEAVMHSEKESSSKLRHYCAKCFICEEIFYSNNQCLDHVLRYHVWAGNDSISWVMDKSGKVLDKKVMFMCSFCNAGMGSLRGVRFHARRIHGVARCPMAVKKNPREMSNGKRGGRFLPFDPSADIGKWVSIKPQLGDDLEDLELDLDESSDDLSDEEEHERNHTVTHVEELTESVEADVSESASRIPSKSNVKCASNVSLPKTSGAQILIEVAFEPTNELLLCPVRVDNSEIQKSSCVENDSKKRYVAKCNVCKDIFQANKECLDHILTSHFPPKEGEHGEEREVILKCGFCEENFDTLVTARFHARKKHGIKRCPMAEKGKHTRKLVERHIKIQGLKCKYGYPTGKFEEDIAINPDEADCMCPRHKPYQCSLCLDVVGYPTLRGCIKHVAACHLKDVKGENIKDYVKFLFIKAREPDVETMNRCDYVGCQYVGATNRETIYHKHWQHNIQVPHWYTVYPCPFCERAFRGSKQFWHHVSIHTSEVNTKDKLCEECGKAFKTNQMLQHHVDSIHFAMKTKQCRICGKSFNGDSSLRTHMRIHMDYRPFRCRYCSTYESNTRAAVRAHVRTQHKDADEYFGVVVDEKWEKGQRHWKKRKVKKKSIDATITGKNSKLCHECGQAFKTNQRLRIHIQTEHTPMPDQF